MPTSPADSVAAPDSPVTRSPRFRTWKAVLRQLVAAVLTVLAVSVVTFLATNIKSPQDVARAALGRHATPEQITAFVAAHDLAAPLPARYAKWLGDLVQGDWGTSVVTDRPIQPELMPRLGRTLLLAGLSFLVVVPLSIALGGYLAARWGTRLDVAATSGLTMLLAFPEFVVGVGAIRLFSVLLGILPPESATAIAFGTPGAKAGAYVLPALTPALVAAPFLVRLTRASAREGLTAHSMSAASLSSKASHSARRGPNAGRSPNEVLTHHGATSTSASRPGSNRSTAASTSGGGSASSASQRRWVSTECAARHPQRARRPPRQRRQPRPRAGSAPAPARRRARRGGGPTPRRRSRLGLRGSPAGR